jgi:3-oxoacyl-[acyl-carrier protein] reductase
LKGKWRWSTGASKGIGAAIAKQLAAEGAAVVVNYASSKSGADAVVDEIKSGGGRAVAVKADLAQARDIERLFAETDRAYGRLDILVNNAGIYEFAPLEEVTEAHFQKQFQLNVLGLILATQAAVKRFGSAGGSIINISSVVSTYGVPTEPSTAGPRAQWMPSPVPWPRNSVPGKIRVNSINPGMVETEGVHAAGFSEGEMRKGIEAQTPLGRIGQTQDIAPAAVYLASAESGWVTGESFFISGGLR